MPTLRLYNHKTRYYENAKHKDRSQNTCITPSQRGPEYQAYVKTGTNTRDGRHTLVIQLIYKRRRGLLIFTAYRLLPEEFDRQKGRAVSPNQRKAQIARTQEINDFQERERAEIGRVFAALVREKKPFAVRDVTTAYRQRYDNRYVYTFFLHRIGELRREGSPARRTSTTTRWLHSKS